jgi:2-polyprenyl-3-methyl-5-hydroxy-6-metoxy-1,4-benzoquinol methylase
MKTIEHVRQYWDHRPCNVRHSPLTIGTREYFDAVEERKYFVESHIPGFADFEGNRGKKVLEIGCGMGTDTMNFARHGCNITAVDLSSASLDLARKRAEVYGLQSQIIFVNANAEELSKHVPVEPYDLIYSFGVIQHSPNPRAIVEEILKYTRPGTEVKMMLYHRFSWKVLWMLLTEGYEPGFIAKHSEAEMGCPVTFAYSKKEVHKLLTGLNVTDVHAEHIFPYNIPEYRAYEYKKVWYFRYIPRPIFRWLEQRFGWHLLITAVAG